jgi:hypothetical protein
MPNLKSMVRSAQSGRRLIVTPLHYRWLELPEDQQRYSERAIRHVVAVLRGTFKRERTGRFSASGLALCTRRQIFSFVGAPQVGIDADSFSLMGVGTEDHIFWQAEGITMKWLIPDSAERFVYNEELSLGGSLDGELKAGPRFELKTVETNKYNKIVRADEPVPVHLPQSDAYALLTGNDENQIVYFDRNLGRFDEYPITSTNQGKDDVVELVTQMKRHVQAGTLPPRLDLCEQRRGDVYRLCPYRVHCLNKEEL